jgi:hypothetical protein
MDPASYRLVYDAAALRFPGWWIPVAGLPAAALGAALLRRRGRRQTAEALGLVLAIFGGAWTVVSGVGLYAQHARLRAALASGAYTTVEGLVYDGSEAATHQRPAGSWRVDAGRASYWYRYSASPFTPGYRRPRPGAGGVPAGARVRIADVSGRIARLEIAQ